MLPEGLLKPSKLLFAACLISMALLVVMTPALNIVAQGDATPTPLPIVGPTDSAAGAAPTAAPADATAVPREKQALDLARAAVAKKVGRSPSFFKYVKAWSWELLLFKDSALGCPASGQTPKAGDAAGYRITFTGFDNTQFEVHVTYDLTTAYICSSIGQGTSGATVLPSAGVQGKAVNGPFEAGGQIQDFNQGTVAAMQKSGMKWVKKQIGPGDGSGPAAVTAAHAQGFKMLFSVKGDKGQVLNAGYFDTFASYVASLASAGADAIEVWNEQNLDREWPTGHIDPGAYTQMLAKSYAAIKAANGNTLVISGALSPTGFWGGSGGKSDNGWDDDVYYAGMAAAGAGQYMDCVGVHYNEGIVSPTQSSGDPRDNYPTRYFMTMLNRAIGPFGNKQACFTELGYLTPEGYGTLPGGFAWAQNTTVAQQAQWLADAAVLAAQSGKVRMMIVFNVDFTYWGADPQAGYAILRPGAVCPACDKLGAVLK